MPLTTGSRLGPYEILEPLGSGGMGEVYRARDTKLGRDVALKVLRDVFAHDELRVARFEREAQMLATLSHPHIAAIYGIVDTDTAPVLVLEFVDGPTLADRITAGGPIPIDEALLLGRQIAEALEAAHEHDIVHRDLKPANIKLSADGTIKVLDFGLAKLIEAERAQASLTLSPSSSAATQEGVILGTAAYMSPEQARGRPVDRRTDLWSFGCVLYEMIAGRQAFETGETMSDAVATILKSDVDWSALPADTPESIRRLLRRCLKKERNERLQSAGDARVEIEEARVSAPQETPSPPAAVSVRAKRGERAAWIAATVVLAGVAATFAVSYFRPGVVELPEVRADIVTPSTPDLMSFAVSPDGRRLVYAAAGDGQTRLWLRALDASTAQPLAGTEGATLPFWSPDSRSIAFFAVGKLKRLDIGAGLPRTLADVPLGQGGTWSQQDVILFSRARISPLYRVPATGGEVVQATKFAAGQTGHRFPQFLPDGKRFLLYASGPADAQGIYVGALDGETLSRVSNADSAAAYAAGWLMFNRGGALIARRFDPAGATLTGDPVTVAEQVGFDNGGRSFSMSAAGPIVYRSGATSRRQLGWFDRSGKALGVLGTPDDSNLTAPALSPDGRRVAANRVVQDNTDVWIVDELRMNRFTVDPSPDQFPVWSPSGDRIVFRSNRGGTPDIYVKATSGAGDVTRLLASPQTKTPTDWSRDGRFVLYGVSDDPKTGYDVWVLPLEGDSKPFPFVNAAYEERNAVFSPDSHWVAYQSNESGRHEVYVRPFPTSTGGQWQVSTGGGIAPRWSPDGKELYYLAPDSKLMAAPIAVKGTALEPGAPVPLFQTHAFGGGTDTYNRVQYDVARDGRFLINIALDDALASPITLLLNWKAKP
jgi:Tol biopolymer transport system component